MARKHQHVQKLQPQIKEIPALGMTQSELEKALGLTGDCPVHALLKRERKVGFSLVHRKDVRAKLKYQVICCHQKEHPVSVMCRFFGVSRSGYYSFSLYYEKSRHSFRVSTFILPGARR